MIMEDEGRRTVDITIIASIKKQFLLEPGR